MNKNTKRAKASGITCMPLPGRRVNPIAHGYTVNTQRAPGRKAWLSSKPRPKHSEDF